MGQRIASRIRRICDVTLAIGALAIAAEVRSGGGAAATARLASARLRGRRRPPARPGSAQPARPGSARPVRRAAAAASPAGRSRRGLTPSARRRRPPPGRADAGDHRRRPRDRLPERADALPAQHLPHAVPVATSGYTQFRLTFDGPGLARSPSTPTACTRYCAGKTPAAGCWEADEESWSFIAGSNAGATVQLDGGRRSTRRRSRRPCVARADHHRLLQARRRRRHLLLVDDVGRACAAPTSRDAVPEDYITGKPGTTYTDPGRHREVRRLPRRLARRQVHGRAGATPTTGTSLWVTEVTTDAPPNPLVTAIANTERPRLRDHLARRRHGGRRRGAARCGRVDRATGASSAHLPLGALKATQPDWSPDNTQLVFATAAGDAPARRALARHPVRRTPGWGAPRRSLRRPAARALRTCSRCSRPTASGSRYSRGKGGHGDLTAQLWSCRRRAARRSSSINANRVVSNAADRRPDREQPADLGAARRSRLGRVQLAARRTASCSPQGTQQIWVAAVDPAEARQRRRRPELPGLPPAVPGARRRTTTAPSGRSTCATPTRRRP